MTLDDLQVYFVSGVAHSGTTILHRLLGRHPESAWFSQFSQRGGNIPGRARIPFWASYNHWGRKIFGVPWKKGRGITEYFVPRPMEANKIWSYLLPEKREGIAGDEHFWEPGEITPEMKEKFKAVFSQELAGWKKEKIICKLPRLTTATLLLAELLPSAKFVHLVRDGRAVALSNLHKFEREIDAADQALKGSARHWKRVVTWMRNTVEPELVSNRLKVVRLEDFQRESEDIFKEILSFYELSEEKFPWPLPEIKEDTNKKWRGKATAQQVQLLENLLSQSLATYDYPARWTDQGE